MSHSKYIDAAFRIGIDICKQGLWNKDRCHWISSNNPIEKKSNNTIYNHLDTDFYNGTSGISYFLSELYLATKDGIVKKYLEGSLNKLLIENTSVNEHIYGFYTGIPGVAFALIKGGKALKEELYLNAGLKLLKSINNEAGKDIINGPVGVVPFLCHLYIETKDSNWLDLALNISDQVLKTAERSELGISWDTMEHKTNNLTGLAHGNAGFAWVFSELYKITRDKKHLEIAEECVRYENNCKAIDGRNWSDFRDFEKKLNPNSRHETGSMAWCHGAPGIGLSRIRQYVIAPNEKYLQDIHDAVDLTFQSLQNNINTKTGNFSLCHGICGNADLLLYYDEVFHDKAKYNNFLHNIAELGISEFINKGIDFPSGLHINQPNISFMLGSAGIGWFYLRMGNVIKTPLLIGI